MVAGAPFGPACTIRLTPPRCMIAHFELQLLLLFPPVLPSIVLGRHSACCLVPTGKITRPVHPNTKTRSGFLSKKGVSSGPAAVSPGHTICAEP
jgi:hypothetical protein